MCVHLYIYHGAKTGGEFSRQKQDASKKEGHRIKNKQVKTMKTKQNQLMGKDGSSGMSYSMYSGKQIISLRSGMEEKWDILAASV